MKLIVKIACFFILSGNVFCQKNNIKIKAILDTENDVLKIQQELIYHNKSDSLLKKIYLHNWSNSFRDRKTPLSQRFIEDFRKDLYFADSIDLGFTKINNLIVNNESATFNEFEKKADIIEVHLTDLLNPNDSVQLKITYHVKIPSAKFTNYGKVKDGYFLRYWYLTPAVFDEEWQLMSNLNIDGLYEERTDFVIEINLPNDYFLESNIYEYVDKNEEKNNYYLVAKSKTDVILSINKNQKFKTYLTDDLSVTTDVETKELKDSTIVKILKKEINFIQNHLGKFPHPEIFVDANTLNKNPVVGVSQLPKFASPFSGEFKWEIEMFKALSRKYIENTILLNQRKDYWFVDGLQNYLMIEYINTYYPNTKLLGKFSNNWLLKRFNLSKLNFNDKYPLVYQFSARKFLDQSLTTSADSLSNFNRKIVNKYKAGLSFRYLKGYLGEDVLKKSIQEFYQKHKKQIVSTDDFKSILEKNTTKNVDWFFEDYIKTNKKIDYTISKVKKNVDSIEVTLKNKRNITTPVSVYGIKNREIVFKKWVTGVDSTTTITLPKGDFNKIALNYENLYPEHNTLDNWESLERKIFNKPLKFSLIKDVQDPYYNQLFYMPNLSYNFYNGLILGVKVHNKPLIKRNLEFTLAPSFGTKSQTVAGQFAVLYNQFFEKTNIYQIAYGVSGTHLDYAPNLSYTSFSPSINVIFKRKSLRDTGNEFIRARMVHINKEVEPTQVQTEQDRYSVLSLVYGKNDLNMIEEFGYQFGTEFSKNFSKAYFDVRYRALTGKNRQLDFRIYGGTFLNNDTTGDYFSFGLDRANDYLFELNYFGRSEDSGLFSQQFIIAEGGFKSVLPTRFANQWMLSFNSSIGIWRWVEFYNDVAFLKNRNQSIYFAYNNGIRFNFVHRILEVYFPLYSNNGWEVGQPNYNEKIRFTLTGDLRAIVNFVRRGFF